MRQRDETLDIARGIAIVAIVLGHVLRGLAGAGIVDGESADFVLTDRILYTFHLSVFALLAGLFVRQSLERSGTRAYLRGRSVLFLYLYVIWALLQGAIELVAAQFTNSPASLADVLAIWRPETQLWFLIFLLTVTCAAALLRPWRALPVAAVTLVAALGFSLLFWGVNGEYAGTKGLGLIVYFWVAVVVGAKAFLRLFSWVGPVVAAVGTIITSALMISIVAGVDATPPTSYGDGRDFASVGLGLVASSAGVAAVLFLSRLLSFAPALFAWLAFVGARSLEIFLAHIIAASGTRIVLGLLDITDPVVHVAAGTFAGVVLPLLLWLVCERLRFPWLFRAPRVPARTREPATP